jgi:hypothetical protein
VTLLSAPAVGDREWWSLCAAPDKWTAPALKKLPLVQWLRRVMIRGSKAGCAFW